MLRAKNNGGGDKKRHFQIIENVNQSLVFLLELTLEYLSYIIVINLIDFTTPRAYICGLPLPPTHTHISLYAKTKSNKLPYYKLKLLLQG